MLRVENIQKSFAEKQALKGINLDIKNGEVYGLVGANGAGKTTFFNIIAQILKPDTGKIFVDDKQIKNTNDLYQNIGYILDIPAMFEYMSAKEYLSFLMSPLNFEKKGKGRTDRQSFRGGWTEGCRCKKNKIFFTRYEAANGYSQRVSE